MFQRITKAAGILLLALAGTVSAITIPVANPSFESPAMGNGGDYFTSNEAAFFTNTSWNRTLALIANPNSQYFSVYNPVNSNFTGSDTAGVGIADGSQVADMSGSTPDSFYQTLTDPTGTLQGYRDYSLTVALGRYIGTHQTPSKISLYAGSDPLAGTLIKQLSIPADTVTADTFQDFVLNVSTAEVLPFLALHQGEPLVIELYGAQGAELVEGQIGFGAWDNVRLTFAETPEPASLSLLGLGSAMMLRRRRST